MCSETSEVFFPTRASLCCRMKRSCPRPERRGPRASDARQAERRETGARGGGGGHAPATARRRSAWGTAPWECPHRAPLWPCAASYLRHAHGRRATESDALPRCLSVALSLSLSLSLSLALRGIADTALSGQHSAASRTRRRRPRWEEEHERRSKCTLLIHTVIFTSHCREDLETLSRSRRLVARQNSGCAWLPARYPSLR